MSERAAATGVAALSLVVLAACPGPAEDCVSAPPSAGETKSCAHPDVDDRDFDLSVPTNGDAPYPVIVTLHGGGGQKRSANRTYCAGGDESDPSCLRAVADREGAVVVAPNGTAGFLGLRTWNGGGGGDYVCMAGRACEEDLDDIGYLDALLDEVARIVSVDSARVYLTGLSNGGALAYRFACERAERVAAIAPIATANQGIAVQGCAPSAPVPVLHMHGTADPIWPYEGGLPPAGDVDGLLVSVDESVVGSESFDGFSRLNGCDPDPDESALDDVSFDGMTSSRRIWSGCDDDASVEVIRVEGGGHTIPGGYQYGPEDDHGLVTTDFVASDEIWRFFSRFSR